MALPSWCTDSVSVLRAPLVSIRGTEERDWGAATRHTVEGCSFQPSSTDTDTSQARRAVSVDAVLYAPHGSDIKTGDRVSFGGSVYSVVGHPFDRESPFSAADHMRVELALWEG